MARQIELVNPQYKKRREQMEIKAIPYMPIGDRLLIKRIVENTYGKEGLIHKPDKYKGTETRGLLCVAGPGALDVLVGHGTLLGDIVWIAKYVDWEQEGWIFGRIEELCGSEDLETRVYGKTKRGGLSRDEQLTAEDVGGSVGIAMDDNGKYIYKFNEE